MTKFPWMFFFTDYCVDYVGIKRLCVAAVPPAAPGISGARCEGGSPHVAACALMADPGVPETGRRRQRR